MENMEDDKDKNGTTDEDELERQRYNRKCCNLVAFGLAFAFIVLLLVLVIISCNKSDNNEPKNEPS